MKGSSNLTALFEHHKLRESMSAFPRKNHKVNYHQQNNFYEYNIPKLVFYLKQLLKRMRWKIHEKYFLFYVGKNIFQQ